jgi:UDP-N-acetylmuramoylalanine--D-glutamate ligase
MNRKLEYFKSYMQGRKVAVLGVGVSNRPLIRYIHRLGAEITAFDMAEPTDEVLHRTMEEFRAEGIGISWSLGKDYLKNLKGFDMVFRTPKVRFDIPELLAERERGAVITSEMEVFLELCPARTFGVTGSDGKTTTTTLISLFLREEGYRVWLGGNIGTPLLDRIDEVEDSDMVVLELSSFQLHTMRHSTDVAVVTNISPNHLDVHKDYMEYIDAKKNLMLYQSFMGRLVLNASNYESKSLSTEARGRVVFFSRAEEGPLPGAFLADGTLTYREPAKGLELPVVPASEIVIPGRHNQENYLAAIAATYGYVSPASMARVARTFRGVEHRMELVRELDGVRYYNSSIDTSPTRTKAALKALEDRGERVVLIVGGKDKKCDYTGLGESILAVCDRVVLCGENVPQIERAIRVACERKASPEPTLVHVADYEAAVREARALARPGEAVVLSPAGTSFDHYRNFEDRGNHYKRIVHGLEG